MSKLSKKNEGFEALKDALIVRKKVTGVLKVWVLQSQKRLEKLEDELANATEEKREELKDKLRFERNVSIFGLLRKNAELYPLREQN